LIIAAAAVILLAAIAYAVFNGGPAQDKPNTNIKFPDYVYTDALALNGYTYATNHPDVLSRYHVTADAAGTQGTDSCAIVS